MDKGQSFYCRDKNFDDQVHEKAIFKHELKGGAGGASYQESIWSEFIGIAIGWIKKLTLIISMCNLGYFVFY